MEDLNKIRKLAGLQEAPQDLDNDQLIFQRLQKLENLFAKFNHNDLKKVMQDMMEGYTKLEKALINNDTEINSLRQELELANKEIQEQHNRLSSLKTYFAKGGTPDKVESVDTSTDTPKTFGQKHFGTVGKMPTVNLKGGKKYTPSRDDVFKTNSNK